MSLLGFEAPSCRTLDDRHVLLENSARSDVNDTAHATEETHGAQNYDDDEKPARQRGWGVAASAALVLGGLS